MSAEVNHAKKIVVEEAAQLADELQNGNGGDLSTQGRAIGLIVKMITPLYEADFVTTQECGKLREDLRGEFIPGVLTEFKEAGSTLKFAGVELSGKPVTALLLKAMGLVPFCVLFFMMGKLLKWW